jgi:hypothetical protein
MTAKRPKSTEVHAAAGAQVIQRIKISDIIVPEVRVTSYYDDETKSRIAGTFRRLGILGALILVRVGDKYEVADGKNRIDQALAAGETEIDAAIIAGSEVDTLLLNLALTKTHGKARASDMVRVIRELVETHGMDSDQIRDQTGLTRDYIEKLMRISTAAPSVQEALDQEIIGVGHAYQISRLPHAIQQDEIIAKYQVWRFPIRDLTEQIDAVLREMDNMAAAPPPGPSAAPSPPRKHVCQGCQQEAEPSALRYVEICPECFSELWRKGKARQAAAAENLDQGGGA